GRVARLPFRDHREGPIRIFEVEACERRQGLEAAQGGEPAADVRAGVPLPALQQRQHAYVPAQKTLEEEVQVGRVADVRELHAAMQKVHPAMRGLTLQGETAGEALQVDRGPLPAGDPLQGVGVALEVVLTGLGLVEDLQGLLAEAITHLDVDYYQEDEDPDGEKRSRPEEKRCRGGDSQETGQVELRGASQQPGLALGPAE